MILFLLTLTTLVLVSTILAITSIVKIHFDNYNYCKEEANAKCNGEDYKYCATIRR